MFNPSVYTSTIIKIIIIVVIHKFSNLLLQKSRKKIVKHVVIFFFKLRFQITVIYLHSQMEKSAFLIVYIFLNS